MARSFLDILFGRKPKPDFSDVQSRTTQSGQSGSGGSIRPDFTRTANSQNASPGARTHTVTAGDTLSHLAQRYYGNASRWPAIFEANRDKLSDPDRIYPGQVLRIPSDADASRH